MRSQPFMWPESRNYWEKRLLWSVGGTDTMLDLPHAEVTRRIRSKEVGNGLDIPLETVV
jgi:hypothetical protein